MPSRLRRRALLTAVAALAGLRARAGAPLEIGWSDLVPPGNPPAGIADPGFRDEVNDVWRPIYDENGRRTNPLLHGARVRLPGFVVPLEMTADGVTEFILVPYDGACIHTPPPPPNQLIHVVSPVPWLDSDPMGAIWLTGVLRPEPVSADLAEIGWRMVAERIEDYEW